MNSAELSPALSISDQMDLIERLQVFKFQGKDRRGRTVLRIIGKLFPARMVSSEALKKFLEEKIYSELDNKPFCVVYVHTGVQRSDNLPGIATLKSIFEAIPGNVRDQLQAVHFLHPGIQSRLFLATFGRLMFSGGLYSKMNYVTRLEFLWEYVKRNEVEIPEFVYEQDEELEYRPTMDYGLESDYPRMTYGGPPAPSVDSFVSVYSMRCIA